MQKGAARKLENGARETIREQQEKLKKEKLKKKQLKLVKRSECRKMEGNRENGVKYRREQGA